MLFHSLSNTHRLGTAEVTRGLEFTRSVTSRRLPRDSEVSYAGHTGALRSIPLSIRFRGMELGFLVRFGIVETTYTVSEFFLEVLYFLQRRGPWKLGETKI